MDLCSRALFAAYVVSQANVLRLLRPVLRGARTLQWSCDDRRVRETIAAWTPAERARYRSHLGPDTVHPFIYVATLIALGRSRPGGAPPGHGIGFAAVTMLVGVCDLIENAFHARHLRGDITPRSARCSGLASRTKWALACVALAELARRARR